MTKLRKHPRLPQQLRAELMRQAGTIGVTELSRKTGLVPSCLYKLLNDGHSTARRSTIERLSAGLSGAPQEKPNGACNGAHAAPAPTPVALPPRETEFTLRVTIGVKRAERLVAHCDLHGVSMSQFVGSLIEARLDDEWGKESA